jgi:hypothetical protein
MTSTSKHGKETAKPVQRSAFKAPAQELEEFKAEVLAMRYGLLIWVDLTARVSINQTCQQANEDSPLIRDAYSFGEWTEALRAVVPVEEYPAALAEVRGKVDELWPEYARLLKRDPDALSAHNKRYEQNCIMHKVRRGVRELKGPGRMRKLAGRDAQIVYMKDVQNYSFGQIARKLKIGREVCESAYYRAKRRQVKLNSH